jgi:TonB-dependent SusC/RagA subfamily outer membrane receptor
MELFLIYLLKSGIWIAVFYLIYWLFFRKEIFFHFNRCFLFLGLLASLLLPLFQYRYVVGINIVNTSAANTLEVTGEGIKSGFYGHWIVLVGTVYILGVVVLLIRQLTGLNKIRRMIRQRQMNPHAKSRIIDTPETPASFSVFGYIFMDKTSILSDMEEKLILEHESAHAEQRHWVDSLFAQMVCCFLWFNPFAWLYLHAIKQNHEFLADRYVIGKGNSQAVYLATLINYTFKAPIFALANSFTYNKFKRITMMKKNVSKPAKKFAVLLVVPALAAFLWAFAEPEYRISVIDEQEMTPDIVNNDTVIIDAKPIIRSRKSADSVSIIDTENDVKTATGVKYTSCDSLKTFHFQTKDVITNINKEENSPWLRIEEGDIQPLYIVDDKEVSSLEGLNPDNIESISVFKDKTAVETYGEKGKNGVIVIKTKTAINDSTQP